MKKAEDFLAQLGVDTERLDATEKSSSQKDSILEASWDEDFLQPFDGKQAQTAQLQQDLQNRALRLLSQREHGDLELVSKLRKKMAANVEQLQKYAVSEEEFHEQLQACLLCCQENNWQSDERYLEQLVNSLLTKGNGPMKIRQKARMNSSRSDLLDAFLDLDSSDWLALMKDVLEKKYGDSEGRLAPKEQAKRMRFLQNRGFSPDLIWRVFR
ncbi:regulatory protein RecX [Thiomicrorhabdus xiamenensis]|uniref:Regulatory protein RecX n=1 Tax=Thiomicrorhabdus xiamenensis TaxID=2739063 RepID=A0A7D4T141_9GAMM|nr:regulatory protein RecX [Thiomicrorhabdus xiamenensis]QKI89642.1 regulatory protein RecX [Thiomicrorhabdus xiamenensis]